MASNIRWRGCWRWWRSLSNCRSAECARWPTSSCVALLNPTHPRHCLCAKPANRRPGVKILASCCGESGCDICTEVGALGHGKGGRCDEEHQDPRYEEQEVNR